MLQTTRKQIKRFKALYRTSRELMENGAPTDDMLMKALYAEMNKLREGIFHPRAPKHPENAIQLSGPDQPNTWDGNTIAFEQLRRQREWQNTRTLAR